jgi:hypothetical protein
VHDDLRDETGRGPPRVAVGGLSLPNPLRGANIGFADITSGAERVRKTDYRSKMREKIP